MATCYNKNMAPNWHSLSIDEIFKDLNTSPSGLSQSAAEKRLDEFGYNELLRKKKRSRIIAFLEQFLSPLIYVLFAAAVISAVVQQFIQAGVIFIVLLLNATIGFFQETQAEKSMEALIRLAAPRARVKRDGEVKQVAAREIVPGDVIVLSQGDRVPADARLIEASNLKVDESAFTGESVAADKRVGVMGPDTPVAERENMIFMATSVTSGRGTAVVTATGMNTEMGEIVAGIQMVKQEKTPVQKGIARLSRYILILVLSIIAILVVVSLARGLAALDVFLLAVAAAVSAIPESLPAVVTVVLAMGMRIMAQRNAVIRRLVAVETLGSATVICSDKTGTLTLNQMTVRRLYVSGKVLEVSGEGYHPEGAFYADSRQIDPAADPDLVLHLRVGALCNDARIRRNDGKWDVVGDPTEGALVVVSAKAGLKQEDLESRFPRVAEIPFESERQYMATLHAVDSRTIVYVKGSPEKIFSLSGFIHDAGGARPVDRNDREKISGVNHSLAKDALRVIATAYMELPRRQESLEEKDIAGKLVFLGLFGMADPPREEAKTAIRACKKAGIRVVMITGDNKVTAESIGRQLELPEGRAVTGHELSEMSDEELRREVKNISVFARIEPLHKLRIVNALKENGEVVAMTGDGVNDAPALKTSDIGVAMGITGTDVAKEASDMVLADDNFASVVAAVEEGRATFNRLRNVVFYLLSTNLGELLALIFSIGFVGVAPLLAVQIIWVNLVTDTSSAIPLSMEPKSGDELEYPPRHPAVGIVYPGLLLRVAFMAIIMGAGLYFIFSWAESRMSLAQAQTLAFTSMVSFEWFRVFNARSDERTVFNLGLFRNRPLLLGIGVAILLQIGVIYLPPLQIAFRTVPLEPWHWGIAIAAGAFLFTAEEVRKVFFPRLFSLGKWRPVKE